MTFTAEDPKDPDAAGIDYKIDWVAELAGDPISASTWIIPAGITKDSDSFTDTTATILISGGTVGETYSMVNRITTAGGRVDDRTITVSIAER